jgi:kynureninase
MSAADHGGHLREARVRHSPATASGAAATDSLLRWRPEFPAVEATLYFVSHSLGAMPRGVEESLRLYAQTWKARGIRAWDESWMAVPAEVAGLLESLLHAEPGSVSLHPNTTVAEASALSAVDFTPPRNRLVCTEEDFPSVLYLYEGLARRGVEVVRVPARDGHRIDEADVVRAVDERTAIVALSQVLFRTSQILDLGPIVQRAREVGALTLISGLSHFERNQSNSLPLNAYHSDSLQLLGIGLPGGKAVHDDLSDLRDQFSHSRLAEFRTVYAYDQCLLENAEAS